MVCTSKETPVLIVYRDSPSHEHEREKLPKLWIAARLTRARKTNQD